MDIAKSSLEVTLKKLKANSSFMSNVTAWRDLPPVNGSFAPFPEWMHPQLSEVLKKQGIMELYSHQREAIEFIKDGQDVVIVTPTASGKTLCYNIPVLQQILEKPATRALYLFPTKALAQDQMKEAQAITAMFGCDIKTNTYDGDTPSDARARIRKQSGIIITNPDMLHTAILPHHTKWQSFFLNLKFVVIDELHIYRGIFGSHFSNVIQRLLRICRFYGQEPIFICCSATVANPQEHAQNILKKTATLVDKNGAPSAGKTFILYNPPIVNYELGTRQSALTPTMSMASKLIDNDIQTIIFTTSRLNVEILTKYLRDKCLDATDKTSGEKIAGYRGGYLPALRREIEEGIRTKKIKGVVSTNALELGIDIGNLDACIICGYPGSIASTWQQAGRAGRKKAKSLVLLVARSNPLDQFIAENPDYFFSSPPEFCRINPNNLLVLLSHIKSASFELPFQIGETFGGIDIAEFLAYLEDNGVLHQSGQQWHWSANNYPANDINLRCINSDNVLLIDTTEVEHPITIAEVDLDSAFTTVFTDAIYMLDGQSYQVTQFDIEGQKAYLKKADVDYYTQANTYKKVCVVTPTESKYSANARVEHG
ncbi:MAG: DEAD/DEAH box helicase, partial [Deltaproteobacteria bacterium]